MPSRPLPNISPALRPDAWAPTPNPAARTLTTDTGAHGRREHSLGETVSADPNPLAPSALEAERLRLLRIVPDYGYEVEISWTRPAPYETILTRGSPSGAEGKLYMILGYPSSHEPKLFYIGKAFPLSVSRRLRRTDHRERYARLRRDHPDLSFRVSLGAIKLRPGHITPARLEEIKSVLILGAYHSRDTLLNRNRLDRSGWKNPYVIRNLRFPRPLPREVHHGVFIR